MAQTGGFISGFILFKIVQFIYKEASNGYKVSILLSDG